MAVGRSREFDEAAVLDAAAGVFWRLGYESVSIGDLEAATGLGRGSLYNAFGDKQGLFLAALDHYATAHGSRPFEGLAKGDVRRGLTRMFDAIVARMADPATPPGCLLTNTATTLGSAPEGVGASVTGKLQGVDALLEAAIARARDEGQVPPRTDPRRLARFYGAVIQGLGAVHRAGGDATALRDIVGVAMEAWPALAK